MLNTARLIIIWLLGLISGFTLMISGNTLNYWLAKVNINLEIIGLFAFISLPYAINFLWAPIFDTIELKIFNKVLDHRLSWICLLGLFLVCFIFILSFIDPVQNLLLFICVAFIISFLSAAKDAILGVFRIEIVARNSYGFISGIYIFGYRIGMLLAGSGAIYLSSYLTFSQIYKIFALLTFIFLVLILGSAKYFYIYSNNINIYNKTEENYSYSLISKILRPIGTYAFVGLIIVFLILYRLPDELINIMINPFLIHLGFSNFEIASSGKFIGVIGAIVGGLIASFIMRKKNILNSMFLFGVLHSIAHILFIILEISNKNLGLLFFTIGIESVTGGMAMTAYIAFISSLCSGKFKVTQYSFFSAMMGFARAVFPTVSGYLVVHFGWQNFFVCTMISTIPSLFLALKIKNRL